MDSKQGHLNGAYYGPPVPPQYNNSIGRRRSPCSCCWPCSLLCSLVKFLVSLIVILGIIVLVLWLVFRPNEIKVYVTSATLSQFNLSNTTTTTTTTTLNYDLSLDMAFRNPNKRIGIYYDYIEAQALYDGSRFAFNSSLPTFYQGHKNTTDLFPSFKGHSLLLGNSMRTTYYREKGEGYYWVEVKLYTRIRLKVWFFKIHAKPKIECTMKLPAPGSSSAVFEGTRCDVDYF